MAYKITIKSTVDGETNEIVAFGNVFKEYGSTAIDFSDEENGNYTKIVIGEDMVSIIKEGDISTVLLFERGKSTFSELSTEYGENHGVTNPDIDLKVDIKAALFKLSDNERTAVLMRYFWGFSVAEIAALNGVSRQAEHRRLKVALDKLRNLL